MDAKKVTKYELVDAIYQQTKYERRLVQDVVDSLLDKVSDSLKAGKAIELRGFGSFLPKLRKGRQNARNPRTGERISVKPHCTVVFKPGIDLKQALYGMELDPSACE